MSSAVPETSVPPGGERLYQRLARLMLTELASGKYAVGDRLPAERELSLEHGVSRPAVREAMIALEVQGYINVRVGAGAFVRQVPGAEDRPGFGITAFELTEARLLFEGEAAALAAINISDAELDELDALVREIGRENLKPKVTENADRAFHRTIAHATRNAAIEMTIDQYWQLRETSPECALLHGRARSAKVRPVVEEHRLIVAALRARSGGGACRDAVASRRGHGPSAVHHGGTRRRTGPPLGRRYTRPLRSGGRGVAPPWR